MGKQASRVGLLIGSALVALSQPPSLEAGEQTAINHEDVVVEQPAVKSSHGGIKSGSGGTVRRGLDMDHDCKVLKKGLHNTTCSGDDGSSSGGGDES